MTEPKQSFTEEVNKEAEKAVNDELAKYMEEPTGIERKFSWDAPSYSAITKVAVSAVLKALSRKTEGREFWIVNKPLNPHCYVAQDVEPKGAASKENHTHVIEHTALVAERARRITAEGERDMAHTIIGEKAKEWAQTYTFNVQLQQEITTLRAEVEELKQYQLIAGEYAEEIQALKTTLATMEEQRNNLVDEVGSGKMWSESTVKYQISKLDLELQKKGQGDV